MVNHIAVDEVISTLSARFWQRVQKTDGCWLWTGSCFQKGYGQFFMNGRPYRAHRVMWEWVYGRIPHGLWVLHNCPGGDNPRCVNPDHLWLGTHAANMADMVKKGRHRAPDRRGELNGRQKLTEADVLELRARHRKGESYSALATAYSLSKNMPGMIVRRELWKHI